MIALFTLTVAAGAFAFGYVIGDHSTETCGARVFETSDEDPRRDGKPSLDDVGNNDVFSGPPLEDVDDETYNKP